MGRLSKRAGGSDTTRIREASRSEQSPRDSGGSVDPGWLTWPGCPCDAVSPGHICVIPLTWARRGHSKVIPLTASQVQSFRRTRKRWSGQSETWEGKNEVPEYEKEDS